MIRSSKTADCPDCSNLNREPGAVPVLRPSDCCLGCKDGYEKEDNNGTIAFNYRCRSGFQPREMPTLDSSAPPQHEYSTKDVFNNYSTEIPTTFSTTTAGTTTTTITLNTSTVPAAATTFDITTDRITNTTMSAHSTLKAATALKTGDIMAIVCSLFFVLIVVGLLMYCFMRRKRPPPSSKNDRLLKQPQPGGNNGRPLKEPKPVGNNSLGQLPTIHEVVRDDCNHNKNESEDVGFHEVIVHQERSNEDEAIPISGPSTRQDDELLAFRVRSSRRRNPLDRVSCSDDSALEECTLSLLKDKSNFRPISFIDSDSKREKDDGSSDGSSPDDREGCGNTVNIIQVHQNFNISGLSGTSVYK